MKDRLGANNVKTNDTYEITYEQTKKKCKRRTSFERSLEILLHANNEDYGDITKTRPFKYIENFTSKIFKNSDKKL